jgi:hypothetical protein
MNTFKLLTALLAVVLFPLAVFADQSKYLAYGLCKIFSVQVTDTYITVSGPGPIWITLEANINGTGSGAVADVYTCTSSSADLDKCDFLFWDHDGNGTKTNQGLDGDSSTSTRGVRAPAGMVRLKFTTSPSVDGEAEVLACSG